MGHSEDKDTGTLTSAAGVPLPSNDTSKYAGKHGPLLVEDFALLEKNAHFNRERIPERVVHALGAGAYGKFTVTDDLSDLTAAKVFAQAGKETPVFVRFSTVARNKGGGDIYRDLRGFSVKFYTEEGNWDLAGNNTPIFFVRDTMRFYDFIRSQKEHPHHNWRTPNTWYDFWSKTPESLHQVLWLMGDRGAPMGFRHMNGYGSHTFSLLDKDGKRTWVKFHWRSDQGRKFFTDDQWKELEGKEPRWATKDLFMAIEEGNFPSWTFSVQTMTDAQAKSFKWNPFDLTKVWPHADFPLRKVGVLELNRNPDNYFAEVEQAAFSPHNVVPGISFSPDPMLQGRILSYPDAHRHRLGVNYEHIPVNQPKEAAEVNTPYQDGKMRTDDNHGARINYNPTHDPYPSASERGKLTESNLRVEGLAERVDRFEDDFYDQPKMFLDMLSGEETERLVDNITGTLGLCDDEVRRDMMKLFRNVDDSFADRVEKSIAEFAPPELAFTPGKE